MAQAQSVILATSASRDLLDPNCIHLFPHNAQALIMVRAYADDFTATHPEVTFVIHYQEGPTMPNTIPHDPDDPAEVAAIQTPEGEPDGQLLDPDDVEFTDESSEDVVPE